MPRLDSERRAALDAVISVQDDLVTAAQLREIGIGRSSVSHLLDEAARWRRLLPGIYLTHRGRPTTRQRRRASLLFAGDGAVLTGSDALAIHGSRVGVRRSDQDAPVLVLVPHHRHRSSAGFVVIERTTRMPRTSERDGLAVADPARAAIDAARRMGKQGDVDALLSDVAQMGLATVDRLGEELDAAQRRGTRLARRTLQQMRAGTRSAPEAELRRLWIATAVPEPLWNPTLTTSAGEFIARPDAYVPEAGVAVEVDSKEFHLAAPDWARTMERHDRMTAHDIAVLHVPPSRLARAGGEFMAEVVATIEARAHRPAPLVRVVPLR